jgi:hypothetical protein
VTLTVTRDYGSGRLASAGERDPAESETVMRLLDRNAGITTRYGGAFVQSIKGIAGDSSGARRRDWFFYVNGIESSAGAASVRVHGGDRIWWDYRDWTSAMRVPAVVGSWPQPFIRGSRLVELDCRGERPVCGAVTQRLREAGARVATERPSSSSGVAARVLVGPWAAVRRDPTARMIESGPARSGVFADYTGGRFSALDERAHIARRLPAGAGLIAALRVDPAPPTWVVTGTSPAGVSAAARLLGPSALRDRYAVATDLRHGFGLPVR